MRAQPAACRPPAVTVEEPAAFHRSGVQVTMTMEMLSEILAKLEDMSAQWPSGAAVLSHRSSTPSSCTYRRHRGFWTRVPHLHGLQQRVSDGRWSPCHRPRVTHPGLHAYTTSHQLRGSHCLLRARRGDAPQLFDAELASSPPTPTTASSRSRSPPPAWTSSPLYPSPALTTKNVRSIFPPAAS